MTIRTFNSYRSGLDIQKSFIETEIEAKNHLQLDKKKPIKTWPL